MGGFLIPERRKGVIIAVDFDDTLQIAGKPNLPLFQSLIAHEKRIEIQCDKQ